MNELNYPKIAFSLVNLTFDLWLNEKNIHKYMYFVWVGYFVVCLVEHVGLRNPYHVRQVHFGNNYYLLRWTYSITSITDVSCKYHLIH